MDKSALKFCGEGKLKYSAMDPEISMYFLQNMTILHCNGRRKCSIIYSDIYNI
jgi:hypothetical protein